MDIVYHEVKTQPLPSNTHDCLYYVCPYLRKHGNYITQNSNTIL